MVAILTYKILSLALVMLLGFLLVRLHVLQSTDSVVLSRLSLFLIMPCVIFSAFQVDYSDSIKKGLILSFAVAISIQIIFFVINAVAKRLLHLDEIEQTSMIYPNNANLVVPLVTAMLGKEWVIYSSTYIAVQLFAIWSHGKSTICGEKQFDIKKTFSNINLITTIIGFIMFAFKLRMPALIMDAVDSVGATIGPISMLITGMLIGGMNLRSILTYKRVWLASALRLIVVPLIMLPFMRFVGNANFVPDSKNIVLISFLGIITPPASSLIQIAQVYGKDVQYSSAINVLTTIFCMATMPIMIMLYQL